MYVPLSIVKFSLVLKEHFHNGSEMSMWDFNSLTRKVRLYYIFALDSNTLSTWCLFSNDCMRLSKGMRGDNSSGSDSVRAHVEHNMAKRYRGILIWT